MFAIKKINFASLTKSLLLSLGTGVAAGLITGKAVNDYSLLDKPDIAPPGWIFPIVWGILYILMGISSYLVYESNCTNRSNALRLYKSQLVLNFFWPIIFFNFKLYTLAFGWILLLWVNIIFMIISFWKCNKTAAYIQLPYLIWVTFATYLTYTVAIMN